MNRQRLRLFILMSILSSAAILLGVAFAVGADTLGPMIGRSATATQSAGIRLLIAGGVTKLFVIGLGAYLALRTPKP
jgi:hypothetical protein